MQPASSLNPVLDTAASWLADADALVIAAGAGMGVDSGLPDFRGDAGLWRAYPALRRASIKFTALANPRTFETNPRLAWGFYGHRLALYRRVRPHAGFKVLEHLSRTCEFGSFVFTSNVDGQFQAADFPESLIQECHGSIHWLQCTVPCSGEIWSAERLEPDIDAESCLWLGPLPVCRNCGALARPNILMFEDGQWISQRTDAQAERLITWLAKIKHPAVVEVGAGVHIATVRRFSTAMVVQRQAKLVRINPRDFEVDTPNAIGLPLNALNGLTALQERLY